MIIIIILVIILIFLYIKFYKGEKFAGSLSNEAIQNISSLYNQEQLKVSNITPFSLKNGTLFE